MTHFPENPNDLSKILGVEPKVTTTQHGITRIFWEPNSNTRIRYESQPGDSGTFNPCHHGEYYHISKGFTSNGLSQGGYETWKGPDGVTVTIKPTGEVIGTQRVWKSDGSGKYSERQDYFGNRLPDQSHSTGHFVE